MSEGLCINCVSSRRCETWGEMKCLVKKQRIYGYAKLTECKFYKKRGKDFKESPCQCEDCLKNGKLVEEDLEE